MNIGFDRFVGMDGDVFVQPEMRYRFGPVNRSEAIPFGPIVVSGNHSVVLLEKRYNPRHLGVV